MKKFTEHIKESQNELNGFVILKPEFLDHTEDFLTLLKNNGWDVVQKEQKKLLAQKEKRMAKAAKKSTVWDGYYTTLQLMAQ